MGDTMPNTLLCPNQLRANGVIVDDCPKQLVPPNRPSAHALICQDQDIQIALNLQGVTSYFVTRSPTVNEIETCQWVNLSDEHNWDPHSDHFQQQEERYDDLQEYHRDPTSRNIYSIYSAPDPSPLSTDMSEVLVVFDDMHLVNLSSTRRSNKTPSISPEQLSKIWNIGPSSAAKTLKCTTQKGIRNTLYPTEQRFWTKQAQLRYRQLSGRHGGFYTDTFFANYPTINGCKMAQIYINDLTFTKVYTMKQKSDVPDTLSSFIHEVGIPHSIHSEDAPELKHGRFKQLCKEYGIANTYTEPYSPWQNRAEGGIHELKWHVHRKMVGKCVPQRLCDF
jgi:hypothetical protein